MWYRVYVSSLCSSRNDIITFFHDKIFIENVNACLLSLICSRFWVTEPRVLGFIRSTWRSVIFGLYNRCFRDRIRLVENVLLCLRYEFPVFSVCCAKSTRLSV